MYVYTTLGLCIYYITGWVVALTCYISHSAKHIGKSEKMTHTHQGAKTPEVILIKLGMVDYVRYPTHMTTLVRVAQRGWSGQICDLSHL